MNHKWEQVVNDMTADLHTLFNSTLSHVAQLLEAVGAMHDGHQEIITFLAPVSGAFAGLRGAIYDYAMVLTFVVLSLAMALRAVTSFPWSLSTLNQLLQQMAICVTLVTVKRFYPTLHQEAVLLGICLELVLVFLRLWKLVFTRSSTVPHDSPPPPDYYTQKLSHSLLPAHSAGSFSKSVTASSSFGKDPLLECLMLLSKKVDDLSSQIGGLHNGGDGATAPVVKLKRDKSQTARRNSDTVAATRKE